MPETPEILEPSTPVAAKVDPQNKFLVFIKPALMTVGTATLGFIGVLLTPAKAVVMHFLYHEDARVILSSDVSRQCGPRNSYSGIH